MTEEEKKAIKYLKNEIERVNKENNFKKMPKEIVCIPLFLTYSETLLNLIEKLGKENLLLSAKENMSAYFEFKRNYISKNKIREKLERLENQKENYKEQPLIYMLLKNQLKSLIEED